MVRGRKIHTAKWDRCVVGVRKKGIGNPYAICTASLGKESFLKKARRVV
jgi:hypothetical protein